MTRATDYDVIIIGGALAGGSTAYHLLQRDPSLRICVIEKDPSYEKAPSALSMAGIRLLFSQVENLQMSQFGSQFYSNFGESMKVDDDNVDLHFWKQGYLFIAGTPEQAADMEENHRFQTNNGVNALLFDAEELSQRFPDISNEGVTRAVFSPSDGWIDPYGALMGLRRKAISLGATYIHGEVVDIAHDGSLVRSVTLADGKKITADHFVNTAGLYAAKVAKMVGMDLPVQPLPRTQYYFECHETFDPLPLTRDQVGVGFRPEGVGFLSGLTDMSRVGNFVDEPNWDAFEEHIWPMLATRVPKFEAIRLKHAWATHYAQNVFDGNAIIGRWEGGLSNFFVIAGCSGHGLQHAPAAGRAISELILTGRLEALDLTRLSYQRIVDNRPYAEKGIKA
ncbi:FAD-binding oxidoreductase [Phyllobacterium sp. YR531]|uniref:NAD(P)/FAD-dependent oxidoreductase n=1 Tax=Phyllobacterium sp. YR531 TaxID=1144343 RepID=UPI00026FB1CF|nr:FAD-binding oxidoreductase [Phyllobacterium sp. YR531]EJN06732.1 glycine/D-amino acid oxidase, deaminating [Phyllobacterium sp. YR531]